VTQSQQHITEPPLGLNADALIVADIPVGCGRERVAAMIEAVTGSSLLGPCYPRAGRQERARRAAEARAVLSPTKRPRKQRRPRLADLLKQAAKADKNVKGAEVYPDRTVLQFGEPTPAVPDNAWPLDEFRTKETKQ
jgi:hypothetical protein